MPYDKRKVLVDHLKRAGYIKTAPVQKAFLSVNREFFVPDQYKAYAYVDEPMPIGWGQTVSAPHMVAMMTELLKPKRTDVVLEVGAGSGYQAAILSGLVKELITIELEEELVKFSRKNIKKAGIRNVKIFHGDGSLGHSPKAPYDKIIITCACPEIPKGLIGQLKEDGKLVAPVGPGYYQELVEATKKRGKLDIKQHGGCVFVPLRH